MMNYLVNLSAYEIAMLIPTVYLAVIICIQFFLSLKVWYVFKFAEENDHHYSRKPFVSIVVPAYNEEVTIVDSVNSFLSQDYPNMNIIIVNDGSRDDTMKVLFAEYDFKESIEHKEKLADRMKEYIHIHTNLARGVYYDKKRDIILIDKANGGKSTALNMGILVSDSEYILGVDADTVLKKNAVTNTLRKKDKDVDAVSCMVGISNDNLLDQEDIQPEFSKTWLVLRQWLEYLTSFVLWRSANSSFKKLTVIPGAFSFIKRQVLLDVNGYKRGYLAEDGELTMNLMENGYKVQFISEFMAWTEAPESFSALQKQRLRWYRGTLQNMMRYKNMLFNPKYHWFLSFFSIPYAWFADILGGWVEVATWLLMIAYIVLGIPIDWGYFFFLWAVIFCMYAISMTLMLTFTHKKLYPKGHSSKIFRIIPIVLIEIFTYHFVNLYWLLRSHINEYTNREHVWNKLKRRGFKKRSK